MPWPLPARSDSGDIEICDGRLGDDEGRAASRGAVAESAVV